MLKKFLFKVLIEIGLLIVLGMVFVILVLVVGFVLVQFFNFFGFDRLLLCQVFQCGGGGGGWFGGDFFVLFQQLQQQVLCQDYLCVFVLVKCDIVLEKNVLVIGDVMVDWFVYGLEDVYVEQFDMGVICKYKIVFGLIKYQLKGELFDWVVVVKMIFEIEKFDVIVVMFGFNDCIVICEFVVDKLVVDKDKKNDKGVCVKL